MRDLAQETGRLLRASPAMPPRLPRVGPTSGPGVTEHHRTGPPTDRDRTPASGGLPPRRRSDSRAAAPLLTIRRGAAPGRTPVFTIPPLLPRASHRSVRFPRDVLWEQNGDRDVT